MTTNFFQPSKEELSSIKEILAKYNLKESRVPTGFADIDLLLAGGLQNGELVVVGSRPSMGKSAFCANIALNVAANHNKAILYYSLEAKKEALVLRCVSTVSGVDSYRMRTENLRDEDVDKVNKALETLSKYQLLINDNPSITTEEIKNQIEAFKGENISIGLVIIDYIQLLNIIEPDKRYYELTEITKSLKKLAQEYDFPVIVASQLSRKTDSRQNKRPILTDISDSSSIEQDADLVLFLYRHEYYEPDDIELRGECEIIVAKNRNGSTGTVKLLFHGATTCFKNYSM